MTVATSPAALTAIQLSNGALWTWIHVVNSFAASFSMLIINLSSNSGSSLLCQNHSCLYGYCFSFKFLVLGTSWYKNVVDTPGEINRQVAALCHGYGYCKKSCPMFSNISKKNYFKPFMAFMLWKYYLNILVNSVFLQVLLSIWTTRRCSEGNIIIAREGMCVCVCVCVRLTL